MSPFKVSDVQLAINEDSHPELNNVTIKIFVFMLMYSSFFNITSTYRHYKITYN